MDQKIDQKIDQEIDHKIDHKIDPKIEDITITNNSLHDIIKMLRDGNIVCLYAKSTCSHKYYFSKATLDSITTEKLICININSCPSLLDEDEWIWYIKESGFVEYNSISILPIDIRYFSLI